MKKVLVIFFLTCSSLFLLWSCEEDDTNPNNGENPDIAFDREAMLTHWADHFIIPGYEAYTLALDNLSQVNATFVENPTESSLQATRESWLAAAKAWQYVSMFEIGKAEEISLRNFTNIYPVDTEAIDENLLSGSYNLNLPSTIDEQGLMALDYLYYGIGSSEALIVSAYTDTKTAAYTTALIEKLQQMSNEVLQDWKGSFRAQFISNSGSSATASVDKLVNDYIFYYEKFLRAGKIGIPAGIFSRTKNPNTVEALYSGQSKILFLEAVTAVNNFFEGKGTTNGPSLRQYSAAIGRTDLGESVTSRFEIVKNKASRLDSNFSTQVEIDEDAMKDVFNELQRNVVSLKSDMLSVLNIRVDFVDADGD